MFHFRSKVASSHRFMVSNVLEESEYARHYFPSILEGLKRRKMDGLIEQICNIKPVMEPVLGREIISDQ